MTQPRRFEFIGGGSEKFWEIDRNATTVTVHFGRIGTAGQTQAKDLGTDAAATAHTAKLVAEKVKKGYVEAGTVEPEPPAPAAGPPTAAPATPATPADSAALDVDVDEDIWTVPTAWWRHTDPFRGRGPKRAPAVVDPAALPVAAELLALCRPQVNAALDNPQSDPELVERARRFLAARGHVDRLGAAGVGAMAARTVDWGRRWQLPAIADAWVAAHGVVVAAEVGVLLGEVEAADTSSWNAYNPSREVVLRRPQGELMGMFWVHPILERLRALLASAGDAEYATAVERLARLRSSPEVGVRVVTSYLIPIEQAWLDETVAMMGTAGLPVRTVAPLLLSATTAAQAMAILDAADFSSIRTDTTEHYSLAAHIGPDAASALDRLFDGYVDAEGKRRILSIIAQLPGDTAFGVLLRRLDQKYVQPALLDAMSRFPRRAMRLLPAVAAGSGPRATTAKDLLRRHTISHPELVRPVGDTLTGAPAELLERLAGTDAAARVAAAEELPAILATPPWESRRAAPKPVVVQGLGPPSPLVLAWKRGEQAAWLAVDDGGWAYAQPNIDWPQYLAEALGPRDWQQIHVFAAAPEALVRPLLRTATPAHVFRGGPSLRRLLARYGHDATAYVVRAAAIKPASLAEALLPIHGSVVAAGMAEWYAESKKVRPIALAWFDRHAATAARDLVPPALGKPGKERTTAETALRVLDQRGHRNEILAAARAHGPEAAQAIDAALAADPLQILPTRIPALPSWLDPAHMSPVLLREGGAALPPSAVAHVCTMLAISRPGATYAGVELVRQAVDPGSLAEMAWSVFERWQGAGYPPKDGWVLEALGLVGDDETVRRLAPLIRAWPGEAAHVRAVAGLDVLAAIGSDVALMHLYGIAEKAKFKGLKTKAQEKMEEAADGLGLTADQLADRLVPDFGLDADGSLLLDYGERRFRVGFDEQLRPVVADEDGSRRKVLPKPGAKDDPVLAPAAYARFTALKKDVKTIATHQIRRFEQAMVAGRRWPAGEHRALFVEHPLLWHLVRRLVWGVFDDRGVLVGSFRVAEDRTLAGSTDAEVALDDDAIVGIAHPMHLGDTLGVWSDVFADYEVLQPFQQLGREVFALTPVERKANHLDRFTGMKVPTGRILGLSHRGWERGDPQDAGIQVSTSKALPGGLFVVVGLDPGVIAGDALEWAEQTIEGVSLSGRDPFGSLDPITASEVLRDLESLRS